MDFLGNYGRYARDGYAFTLFLSSDPSLAEDLTSEAFVGRCARFGTASRHAEGRSRGIGCGLFASDARL